MEHSSFLRATAELPQVGTIEVFRLCQVLSSVLGITILAAFYRRHVLTLELRETSSLVDDRKTKRVIAWIACLSAVLALAACIDAAFEHLSLHGIAYRTLIVATRTFVILYVLVCIRGVAARQK